MRDSSSSMPISDHVPELRKAHPSPSTGVAATAAAVSWDRPATTVAFPKPVFSAISLRKGPKGVPDDTISGN
jgi:hypothetical protein